MKLNKYFLSTLVLVSTILLSCGNISNRDEDSYELASISETRMDADEAYASPAMAMSGDLSKSEAPTSVRNFVGTVAAIALNDGKHKFIRKANLRFKVEDVVRSSYRIEDIALQNEGFIIHSEIRDDNSYTDKTQISSDSILVTKYINLDGSLHIRIPHHALDTTLRQIAPLAKKIDYRTVTAEDVSLKLLSDKLNQIRNDKKQQRIGKLIGANRSQKLEDLLQAEEAIDDANENADKAVLSTYSLNDQIDYSSITISLYSDPIVSKYKEAKEVIVSDYRSGFVYKFKEALSDSWELLLDIFLFIISAWPVLLIIGTVIWGIILLKRNRKAKKNKIV